MKSDETYLHLRASAVLFADAQADELVHQFEEGAEKNIKLNASPDEMEVGFAQQNSEGLF